MKKLTVLTLLPIYFEVISALAIITIQNDPSKPPTHSYVVSSPGPQIVSLPRQPTISRQWSKPGYAYPIGFLQLQPRNILGDIISSPIQSLVRYMLGGVYALTDMFRYQQNASINKPANTFNLNKQTNIPSKSTVKTTPTNKTKPTQAPPTENFRGSLFFNALGQLINFGNPSQPEQPINAKVASGIPVQQPGRTVTVEGKNGKIYVNNVEKYCNDERFKKNHQVCIEMRDGNFYVNDNLVMKKGRSDHDKVIQSRNNLNYKGVTHFVLKIHSDGYLNYEDDRGGRVRVNYYTPIQTINSFSSWL